MITSASLLKPQTLCDIAQIQPGNNVADFGCGHHGALAHHVAQIVGVDGRVYGVDIRPQAVEMIGRSPGLHAPPTPIEPVWADIELYGSCSIPHDSLDVIFIVDVISYLSNVVGALREAQRLLGPGGRVVVVEWGHSDHPLSPSEPVTPESVARAAADLGLVFDQIIPASDHHWSIVLHHT